MYKQDKYLETQQLWGLLEGKEGGGIMKGREDWLYGDGRRFDFGWWAHNAMYRWSIIEIYILETYIMLLTNIIPIHLRKIKMSGCNIQL